MKITLIAAVDDQMGIGKDNEIVWQNDEDMKHFRQYTENKVVVMGRKTWDSLPVQPLPRRYNWVISSNKNAFYIKNQPHSIVSCYEHADDVIWLRSYLDDTEEEINELCIIGGQSIYEQFMPHATHIVLTRIKGDYQCDRFFPVIDLNVWHRYDIDVKDTCRIEYYKRKG